MRISRCLSYMTIAFVSAVILCACNAESTGSNAEPTVPATAVGEIAEDTSEDDGTDGLGDTFKGETKPPADDGETGIDLVMFMGQYNMSGEGGDASLAPKVAQEAGMEFRAVSDPTRLYPIEEPFGVAENNPSGLNEFPGVKKGSLVSAFVNEYYNLTGRKIIAVSASMSNADMDIWTSDGVKSDVRQRLSSAMSYLESNGYKADHVYILWLHGESDAIKGSAANSYTESLENVMKPLFSDGVEKVFIITPGRTIDYTDIYHTIIKAQTDLCRESSRYAAATTVLSRVSTEYMVDQYHYNQHVLNYVGTVAAGAVAYYTLNGVEKIVYDYADGEYIVPKGVSRDSQPEEDIVYPSEIDINEMY